MEISKLQLLRLWMTMCLANASLQPDAGPAEPNTVPHTPEHVALDTAAEPPDICKYGYGRCRVANYNFALGAVVAFAARPRAESAVCAARS